jgi:hypothetical protein
LQPATNLMKREIISVLLILITSALSAQELQTPLQKNNYSRLTSYDELNGYVNQIDSGSGLLTALVLGKSVKGRNLYALNFSSTGLGKDPSRIKVLIIAQQHGNEQSGKEGALLLAQELLKPGNRYLFDRIDLTIVPQMNPDGSEENKRRNGNEADLNRNHLILTEPETIALHRFFDKYLFEVTMDVHEYYPYGETWRKFGYRDNSDELLGTTNNINISKNIKDLSDRSFLPFMRKYFTDRHFTSFTYCPGGPPEIDYIRHSTFDINDGRQSFGIQNSFSFIQEGMNGKDDSIDNLKHRAEGQMTGMRGLLEYAYQNKNRIKKMVTCERKKLINEKPGKNISIQSEHVKNGELLKLPLRSYFTDNDTVITVIDYRPVVKSLCDVKKPYGYLIPKRLKDLIDWAGRHEFITETYIKTAGDEIEQYEVTAIDSIDFERDIIINPIVSVKEFHDAISADEYIFVPTSQLKGNLIVLALEPKSMLGLVTYNKYAYLIKAGDKYPVLRVAKKQKLN